MKDMAPRALVSVIGLALVLSGAGCADQTRTEHTQVQTRPLPDSAPEEGRGLRLVAMVGSDGVDSVAFSPDGRFVLTTRGSVAILSAITGEETRRF